MRTKKKFVKASPRNKTEGKTSQNLFMKKCFEKHIKTLLANDLDSLGFDYFKETVNYVVNLVLLFLVFLFTCIACIDTQRK